MTSPSAPQTAVVDAPATRRPRRSPGADLARIAVMAALIAVLGAMPGIPVPGIPAPITLQTLGVMLAGLVLGAWRGAASLALFHLLVALGLPLLAGGRGGAAVFVGPSAGFLWGWIPGAFVVGLLFHLYLRGRRDGRNTGGLFAAALTASVVGGIAVIYLFGIPGMTLFGGVPLDKAAIGSLAFIPGDLLKAVVAALLAAGLSKAYPRAFA